MNKPKPKSQSEIFSGESTNPNLPFVIRRDTDTIPNFRITLRDIDTAVIQYIQTVINPTIEVSGQLIKVPIIYMSPEKWKGLQYDGFYRDKDNKIQLPLIGVRRSSLAKNRIVTRSQIVQFYAV